MNEKTEQTLLKSYAEESRSAARNRTFALKADQEGQPAAARLFRALAEADSVLARRYLLLLGGKIGTTAENLEAALHQSDVLAEENARRAQAAASENQPNAESAFDHSRRVRDSHVSLIRGLQEGRTPAKDSDYYVCQICGYISESRAPDRCPICGAIPGKFKWVG